MTISAILLTLGKNSASIDENASAIDLQIAQIDDRLAKCRIIPPMDGTVLEMCIRDRRGPYLGQRPV